MNCICHQITCGRQRQFRRSISQSNISISNQQQSTGIGKPVPVCLHMIIGGIMIGFFIGLFVGGFFGVAIMCYLNVASEADDQMEREQKSSSESDDES